MTVNVTNSSQKVPKHYLVSNINCSDKECKFRPKPYRNPLHISILCTHKSKNYFRLISSPFTGHWKLYTGLKNVITKYARRKDELSPSTESKFRLDPSNRQFLICIKGSI